MLPFDLGRIERAAAAAVDQVGRTDGKLASVVARAVAGQLAACGAIRPPGVEEIQDELERQLMVSGEHEVGRAYAVYRHRRAELRKAKTRLEVRNDLKLGLAAVTVLRQRYLLKDRQGGQQSQPAR